MFTTSCNDNRKLLAAGQQSSTTRRMINVSCLVVWRKVLHKKKSTRLIRILLYKRGFVFVSLLTFSSVNKQTMSRQHYVGAHSKCTSPPLKCFDVKSTLFVTTSQILGSSPVSLYEKLYYLIGTSRIVVYRPQLNTAKIIKTVRLAHRV